MSKKLLIATSALAVLGFATASGAGELKISVGAVDASPGVGAYTIASEVSGTHTGAVTIGVDYDAAAIPADNNLKLRFALHNGATFSSIVGGGDITGFGNVLVIDGGGIGQNFVEFLVSNPNDDVDAGDFTHVELAANITFADGATPGVTVYTQTEANTPIEGGWARLTNAGPPVSYTTYNTASPYTFIGYSPVFSVSSTDILQPNQATIASGFTNFGAGPDVTAELGNVVVTLATAYKDLAGNNVATTDLDGGVITVSGTSTAGLTLNGATPPGSWTLVFDDTAFVGNVATIPVNLTAVGVVANSNYSANVALDLVGGFADPAASTVELGKIRREGAEIFVPWIGSGTGAGGAAQAVQSLIRISNFGGATIGNMYVELVTATNATPGALVPLKVDGAVVTGLDDGDELLIDGADLIDSLGVNFVRGDLRITIEGDEDSLTVFRRDTRSGLVTNIPLGVSKEF